LEITSDTPAMAGDIIDAAAAGGATSVGDIRCQGRLRWRRPSCSRFN
jgi:hypothetical protein